MNKRIISLCLALVLLLCLLPAAAPTAAADGDVAINETNFPDDIFRSSYVSETFDQNGDGVLSPTEISNVTEIWCSECGIASLKGIEFFTALETLYCNDNQLTLLDVSRNAALKWLWCDNNQLSALDVSKNTALESLQCYNNQLTSLDVSGCTALELLDCGGNQLTSLDVSKNTALYRLSCDNNQLTSLDVSKNTALELLWCYNNQLTALDVSRNTALGSLWCYNNQLTSLNVSGCTALEWLSCSCNQLTALDVSKNAALEYLSCYGNKLTVLDLSAVPKLLDALEKGMKSVRSKDNVVRYMVHNGEYNWITDEELYDEIEMDLNQKTIPASNPFLDVTADDYFNDAVSWAYQNGVASGTSKTKFSPAKTCTREQVVTFLWRAKGCPEPTGTNNPFKDVPSDAYYTKAVLWAVENGITNGKSKTKFGVGDPCTREQVVTFLWRAEGEPEPTSAANPFKDVSETDYFYKAVLWAVENGITNGTSKTKFSPTNTCTRGQVVTFLYRDVVGEQ